MFIDNRKRKHIKEDTTVMSQQTNVPKLDVPLSSPQISQDDIDIVVEILRSGRLSIGAYTEMFEESVASFVGTKYAVAVSSGTAALHLILKSIDFSKDSILVVPSFTFVASANVGMFEGGRVEFVDIEPETLNMDPGHLEYVLEKLSKENKKLFLMAVDIFGHSLDWDRVLSICDKYNVTIVEDSCEALGSEYKGKKVGTFGVAGAYGFYPNKQITTGEGGVLVTDDEHIYKVSRALRNQGRGEGQGWLAHDYVGYNYRIDEMSSGLGWSQMKRIDAIIQTRSEVANRYNAMLKCVETPIVKDYVSKMSWFIYVVRLPKGTKNESRNKVMEYLENSGVHVRNYFEPVHLQKPYRELGWKEGMLPITEEVAERTIALPFFTDMTKEQQEYVVNKVEEAISKLL